MLLAQEQRVSCAQHRKESQSACELWECRCREEGKISPIWRWDICATCLHLPKDEAAKLELEDLTISMEMYKWGQERP